MSVNFKMAEPSVVPGKYRAKAGFPPDGERLEQNQVSVSPGQIVVVQGDREERGWVWVANRTPSGKVEYGYLPRNYLVKVPEGDLDRWAYGCEVVACFYGIFSGMFVLLYASAEKLNPNFDIAMGAIGIILSSLLMIMIFFRNDIEPQYRALCIFGAAIPSLIGFPIGVWGAIVLILACTVELCVWQLEDEKYVPETTNFSRLCESLFSSSFVSIFVFLIWVASNIAIFVWGYEVGSKDADEWQNNEDEQYFIGKTEWAFTNATAFCIMFQLTCMLILALQGFHTFILACFGGNYDRGSTRFKLKEAVLVAFSKESMISVHRFIAFSLLICSTFHVMGAFTAFENSGPAKDFDRLFEYSGKGSPTYTGGVLAVLIAIIMSSAFIDYTRQRKHFQYVHMTSVAFIFVLVLHGRHIISPNVWKWLLGPFILYLLDKAFRYGVFGIQQDEPEELLEGPYEENYDGQYEAQYNETQQYNYN